MPPRQLWKCPKCGQEITAWVRASEVYCSGTGTGVGAARTHKSAPCKEIPFPAPAPERRVLTRRVRTGSGSR